ncbi:MULTISPECIES: hypothetical protein [unclassified Sphingomonas]|uniref:DUF3617 domain-containing protein n=1 Tax=unclassified Sphingomonas TaxID=196159 RepID=UPI001ACB345E|nr:MULTISPECIES: hypothetical protein [unclassified Sphingomonas]MBN8849197.1 hypothetical protein [Sphingomonas sp.]MBS0285491.1 hypothetical protein [Pseudomonadota bacterium]
MKRFALLRPAALLLAAVAAGAVAQEVRMIALGGVEPGAWSLHEIGNSAAAPRAICVHDPRLLLQLVHGPAQCAQYVIEDQPNRVTVQYRCPGQGYGRTTIRVEDRNLIRVQTQGLMKGAPFDFDYEGRRTGKC